MPSSRFRFRLPAVAAAWCAALCTSAHGAVAQTVPAAPAPAPTASGAPLVAPPVRVFGTAPLPGGAIDTSKIPAAVHTLTTGAFDRTGSANVLDTLGTRVPSGSLSDVQGNPFQEDFRYRGFAASPLQGTPEGIAVYQNGIRLNEPFGDTVNWDLVPPAAIEQADVWSNNPLFGLNALGGAVSLQMKNGFTWQGSEIDLRSGTFGDDGMTLQHGAQHGPFASYVALDGLADDGWRYHSPSDLARFYADLGWKSGRGELHVVGGAASNFFGVIGPTPIQLLQNDPRAIWTWPQTTQNQMQLLAVNGRVDMAPAWSLDASLSGRWFEQAHLDGNPGDFAACDPSSAAPGALCLDASGLPTPPAPIPPAWFNQLILYGPAGQTFPFVSTASYGTIDATRTETATFAGTLQATSTARLFGLTNRFLTGVDVEQSAVRFRASTELDVLNPDFSAGPSAGVPGTGSTLTNVPTTALGPQYTVQFQPVDLTGHPTYWSWYATDTLDLTARLSATAGVRVNVARITTSDDTGTSPELDASYAYARANPVVGVSYKTGANASVYAGYSEANRIPTTLELDCSSPTQPCVLANSLVPDPPLRQVVAHTYEIGARDDSTALGRVHWSAALFRTDADDDIVSVASTIPGFSYYTNVPATRRQGLELAAQLRTSRWLAYANYGFTDATYRFGGTLASPNNPQADANGNIAIVPGDRIPGIPAQQLTVGWDYTPVPAWTVGADVLAATSQYYAGDDGNQNPLLPGYAVANLHATYRLNEHVELFGTVNNLFDARYATYGTYFGTTSVPSVTLTDPRTITPAAPLAGYAGIRLRW